MTHTQTPWTMATDDPDYQAAKYKPAWPSNEIAEGVTSALEELLEWRSGKRRLPAHDELVAALLEISQVACSNSPEQHIANAALAKVSDKPASGPHDNPDNMSARMVRLSGNWKVTP